LFKEFLGSVKSKKHILRKNYQPYSRNWCLVADVDKLVLLILNVEQSATSLAELLDAGRVAYGHACEAAVAWRKL
jgi:hypothetical protein